MPQMVRHYTAVQRNSASGLCKGLIFAGLTSRAMRLVIRREAVQPGSLEFSAHAHARLEDFPRMRRSFLTRNRYRPA
jgi:hypothetical protein